MRVYEVAVRLLLAIIIGGLIGYEREYQNRPAGFRTHILVCIGACVISMIQLYDVQKTVEMIGQNPQLSSALKADIGRIGAQVVSGVGFLGAGTILHEKGSVKGLTTAASLWVVACIGLAVGLGYYVLSILSTVAVVIALVSLKKFEAKFIDKSNLVKLEIEYMDKQGMVQMVNGYFEGKNIKIKNIEFLIEEVDGCEDGCMKSLYTILIPRHIRKSEIIKHLASIEEVIRVTVK
ncbi:MULTISPECIES: MgtC/SapB family protein [Clostridium]|uniref:MgtC/SapB transporter n=2 Tax=Clostridium TaxID=1485 RepID=A0A0E3JZX8_CLOSL|nr:MULTISPECIES: MgtC/SapB family protein [Clostridium]AKA68764.1 MgtC/SapB transporter [Clostridium scatologenes]AWI05017.1 methyltransferase [Clostridium drakei]